MFKRLFSSWLTPVLAAGMLAAGVPYSYAGKKDMMIRGGGEIVRVYGIPPLYRATKDFFVLDTDNRSVNEVGINDVSASTYAGGGKYTQLPLEDIWKLDERPRITVVVDTTLSMQGKIGYVKKFLEKLFYRLFSEGGELRVVNYYGEGNCRGADCYGSKLRVDDTGFAHIADFVGELARVCRDQWEDEENRCRTVGDVVNAYLNRILVPQGEARPDRPMSNAVEGFSKFHGRNAIVHISDYTFACEEPLSFSLPIGQSIARKTLRFFDINMGTNRSNISNALAYPVIGKSDAEMEKIVEDLLKQIPDVYRAVIGTQNISGDCIGIRLEHAREGDGYKVVSARCSDVLGPEDVRILWKKGDTARKIRIAEDLSGYSDKTAADLLQELLGSEPDAVRKEIEAVTKKRD